MKKCFLIVIIILTMTLNDLHSQQAYRLEKFYAENYLLTDKKDSVRKIFIYSNTGILEFLSFGVGYQVSQDFAISLKYSNTFIGSGFIFPNTGSGIGIKLSYYTPFSIFNCINAEYVSYLILSTTKKVNSVTKGNFFEANIGKEIVKKEGLRVFWSLGLAISNAKMTTVVFAPSIKIGINYNLF
ncbi:hypothetical protein ABRY23_03125 [Melioribacteraceae bacterium 4301-Me]|uniref:hypothetical protein n=1 Tax=Pyranulibacter aquaticus TaxID=3163344 RepID=UPI00359AA5EB